MRQALVWLQCEIERSIFNIFYIMKNTLERSEHINPLVTAIATNWPGEEISIGPRTSWARFVKDFISCRILHGWKYGLVQSVD